MLTETSLPCHPVVFSQTSILFKLVQLYVEMTKDSVYKAFSVWYLIGGQNAVFLEFDLICAKVHQIMEDTKVFQSH